MIKAPRMVPAISILIFFILNFSSLHIKTPLRFVYLSSTEFSHTMINFLENKKNHLYFSIF